MEKSFSDRWPLKLTHIHHKIWPAAGNSYIWGLFFVPEGQDGLDPALFISSTVGAEKPIPVHT